MKHRKISWIGWNTVCARKEEGGLGVRKMREFNITLLGKWCWRMLVDRSGLWYRVLVARYSLEDGVLREGGMRASYWWKEVGRVRDGGGGVGGGWFKYNIFKKVGDGRDTLFWTDPWLERGPLAVRFKCLYDLSVFKNSMVREMFELGVVREVTRGVGEGGCGIGRMSYFAGID